MQESACCARRKEQLLMHQRFVFAREDRPGDLWLKRFVAGRHEAERRIEERIGRPRRARRNVEPLYTATCRSASCALRDEVLPLARDEQEARMPGSTSRLRAGFAALLLVSAVSACGYNAIPPEEEQAKAKWADVQNNYQRRADLIPNLVATVQGYAKQEREVLTAVVEARAKATQVKIDVSQLSDPEKLKQFQDAQNQLSGALGRLLAVSETYPDLKSNQNFLALQSQLECTENRIAVARRDYT